MKPIAAKEQVLAEDSKNPAYIVLDTVVVQDLIRTNAEEIANFIRFYNFLIKKSNEVVEYELKTQKLITDLIHFYERQEYQELIVYRSKITIFDLIRNYLVSLFNAVTINTEVEITFTDSKTIAFILNNFTLYDWNYFVKEFSLSTKEGLLLKPWYYEVYLSAQISLSQFAFNHVQSGIELNDTLFKKSTLPVFFWNHALEHLRQEISKLNANNVKAVQQFNKIFANNEIAKQYFDSVLVPNQELVINRDVIEYITPSYDNLAKTAYAPHMSAHKIKTDDNLRLIFNASLLQLYFHFMTGVNINPLYFCSFNTLIYPSQQIKNIIFTFDNGYLLMLASANAIRQVLDDIENVQPKETPQANTLINWFETAAPRWQAIFSGPQAPAWLEKVKLFLENGTQNGFSSFATGIFRQKNFNHYVLLSDPKTHYTSLNNNNIWTDRYLTLHGLMIDLHGQHATGFIAGASIYTQRRIIIGNLANIIRLLHSTIKTVKRYFVNRGGQRALLDKVDYQTLLNKIILALPDRQLLISQLHASEHDLFLIIKNHLKIIYDSFLEEYNQQNPVNANSKSIPPIPLAEILSLSDLLQIANTASFSFVNGWYYALTALRSVDNEMFDNLLKLSKCTEITIDQGLYGLINDNPETNQIANDRNYTSENKVSYGAYQAIVFLHKFLCENLPTMTIPLPKNANMEQQRHEIRATKIFRFKSLFRFMNGELIESEPKLLCVFNDCWKLFKKINDLDLEYQKINKTATATINVHLLNYKYETQLNGRPLKYPIPKLDTPNSIANKSYKAIVNKIQNYNKEQQELCNEHLSQVPKIVDRGFKISDGATIENPSSQLIGLKQHVNYLIIAHLIKQINQFNDEQHSLLIKKMGQLPKINDCGFRKSITGEALIHQPPKAADYNVQTFLQITKLSEHIKAFSAEQQALLQLAKRQIPIILDYGIRAYTDKFGHIVQLQKPLLNYLELNTEDEVKAKIEEINGWNNWQNSLLSEHTRQIPMVQNLGFGDSEPPTFLTTKEKSQTYINQFINEVEEYNHTQELALAGFKNKEIPYIHDLNFRHDIYGLPLRNKIPTFRETALKQIQNFDDAQLYINEVTAFNVEQKHILQQYLTRIPTIRDRNFAMQLDNMPLLHPKMAITYSDLNTATEVLTQYKWISAFNEEQERLFHQYLRTIPKIYDLGFYRDRDGQTIKYQLPTINLQEIFTKYDIDNLILQIQNFNNEQQSILQHFLNAIPKIIDHEFAHSETKLPKPDPRSKPLTNFYEINNFIHHVEYWNSVQNSLWKELLVHTPKIIDFGFLNYPDGNALKFDLRQVNFQALYNKHQILNYFTLVTNFNNEQKTILLDTIKNIKVLDYGFNSKETDPTYRSKYILPVINPDNLKDALTVNQVLNDVKNFNNEQKHLFDLLLNSIPPIVDYGFNESNKVSFPKPQPLDLHLIHTKDQLQRIKTSVIQWNLAQESALAEHKTYIPSVVSCGFELTVDGHPLKIPQEIAIYTQRYPIASANSFLAAAKLIKEFNDEQQQQLKLYISHKIPSLIQRGFTEETNPGEIKHAIQFSNSHDFIQLTTTLTTKGEVDKLIEQINAYNNEQELLLNNLKTKLLSTPLIDYGFSVEDGAGMVRPKVELCITRNEVLSIAHDLDRWNNFQIVKLEEWKHHVQSSILNDYGFQTKLDGSPLDFDRLKIEHVNSVTTKDEIVSLRTHIHGFNHEQALLFAKYKLKIPQILNYGYLDETNSIQRPIGINVNNLRNYQETTEYIHQIERWNAFQTQKMRENLKSMLKNIANRHFQNYPDGTPLRHPLTRINPTQNINAEVVQYWNRLIDSYNREQLFLFNQYFEKHISPGLTNYEDIAMFLNLPLAKQVRPSDLFTKEDIDNYASYLTGYDNQITKILDRIIERFGANFKETLQVIINKNEEEHQHKLTTAKIATNQPMHINVQTAKHEVLFCYDSKLLKSFYLFDYGILLIKNSSQNITYWINHHMQLEQVISMHYINASEFEIITERYIYILQVELARRQRVKITVMSAFGQKLEEVQLCHATYHANFIIFAERNIVGEQTTHHDIYLSGCQHNQQLFTFFGVKTQPDTLSHNNVFVLTTDPYSTLVTTTN